MSMLRMMRNKCHGFSGYTYAWGTRHAVLLLLLLLLLR